MENTKQPKINKCDYGYLNSKLKKELIKTIILFIIPISIIIFGYIKEGTNKNIFTLIAVLGLLPAANNFVTLIMSIKAKKWASDVTLYNKVANTVDLSKVNVRFDLYMTGYDKTFPIQSICCIGNSLFGYTTDPNFNDEKFEDHLKPLLSQNGLKVGNIKIFNNMDKYLSRLGSAASSFSSDSTNDNNTNNDIQSDHDLKILRLMENISL